MTKEIKAPTLPESVADGMVAAWHKQPGEAVKRDDLLVDIETDKAVLEVSAPADGVLVEIFKTEGDIVLSEELLASFAPGGAGTSEKAAPAIVTGDGQVGAEAALSPAVRKLLDENALKPEQIVGSGKNGRVIKEDVLNYLQNPTTVATPVVAQAAVSEKKPSVTAAPVAVTGERPERRVTMTRMRATIARRLVEAQQTAAMLTTFNEVNMAPIMALRKQHKERFMQAHEGTRLGFMSFFVRASVEALKRFPGVNASIDGNDIVYHGYQDIGVAVSSPRGLVVPVLRDTDRMGLAEIERTIAGYGEKAQAGKLSIDEMTGGTFTISNGGVFGSLMSTPIINPPQTAVLGMHKIQERPMAVNGQVEILPMMYLALSYDHRMIDGKEAVQFLVTIKELLEDPARILLEI